MYPRHPIWCQLRLRIEGAWACATARAGSICTAAPGFDPKTRTLSITNIDFVGVSDNPLLQAASRAAARPDQSAAGCSGAHRPQRPTHAGAGNGPDPAQSMGGRAVRDRDNASGQAEKLAICIWPPASMICSCSICTR